MGNVLLALDQGTTSTRAIVFGPDLLPVATAQQELPQHFPAPGWVEHEPEDIWQGSLAVLRGAMRQAGATPPEVAGIGITNQRETVVLWDRASGRAVHRAIVWQDRRTAEACARLRDSGQEALISRRTGLLAGPLFLGDQAGLAAGPRPRRPRPGRTRGAGLRHGRQLPALAADRRAGACDGRDQCRAHPAVRHHPRLLGCRIAAAVRHSAPPSCRRCATAPASSA